MYMFRLPNYQERVGSGQGIEEDFEAAEHWLRKAAAAGSQEARMQMRDMGLKSGDATP